MNGAGRDWWAKKKKSFYGIFSFSIPNNNNGPSSGLIFRFLDFWPGLLTHSINESMNDKAVYRTAPATMGLLKNVTLPWDGVNVTFMMRSMQL